jgi:hypothetical protein
MPVGSQKKEVKLAVPAVLRIGIRTKNSERFTRYLDILAASCSATTTSASGKGDRFKAAATLCARL